MVITSLSVLVYNYDSAIGINTKPAYPSKSEVNNGLTSENTREVSSVSLYTLTVVTEKSVNNKASYIIILRRYNKQWVLTIKVCSAQLITDYKLYWLVGDLVQTIY